jgi:sec-independent protein translocase protein TatB
VSGIGFSELIILALIGLIVLGPERLPRVANQIGGWLGQARRMTRVMKRQLEDELDFDTNPTIKQPPVSREPSKQPEYTPPRDDDEFSPAHETDDIGTGVSDIEDTDDSVSTTAEPENSPDVDVDEVVDATPDTEPKKQTEKAS